MAWKRPARIIMEAAPAGRSPTSARTRDTERSPVNTDGRLTTRQKIDQGVAACDRNAYADALAICSQVIEEQADFPGVHNRAGLGKGMLGDLEGALDEFEGALELAATYGEAHFSR